MGQVWVVGTGGLQRRTWPSGLPASATLWPCRPSSWLLSLQLLPAASVYYHQDKGGAAFVIWHTLHCTCFNAAFIRVACGSCYRSTMSKTPFMRIVMVAACYIV